MLPDIWDKDMLNVTRVAGTCMIVSVIIALFASCGSSGCGLELELRYPNAAIIQVQHTSTDKIYADSMFTKVMLVSPVVADVTKQWKSQAFANGAVSMYSPPDPFAFPLSTQRNEMKYVFAFAGRVDTVTVKYNIVEEYRSCVNHLALSFSGLTIENAERDSVTYEVQPAVR
jgi:hypothetical protein